MRADEMLDGKEAARPGIRKPKRNIFPTTRSLPIAIGSHRQTNRNFPEKICSCLEKKFIPLQLKIPFMRTRTPYVAPGTCAAPERGRGLQNWATNRERMEVVREIWKVVKSNLEGVVIRSVGAYNSTFGVRITNCKRLNSDNVLFAIHVKCLANSTELRKRDKLADIY
jgi:hypothetical protein